MAEYGCVFAETKNPIYTSLFEAKANGITGARVIKYENGLAIIAPEDKLYDFKNLAEKRELDVKINHGHKSMADSLAFE